MQMLQIILADGRPNITIRDLTGKTALLTVVRNKWIDIAKSLLAQKMIDVNVADDCGWTPLMAGGGIGDRGYFAACQGSQRQYSKQF
jgi:ankyrin repeat protein